MSHPISQILKHAGRLVLMATAVWTSTFHTAGFAQVRDSYVAARLKMVEENLVREGIKNEGVLKAMRSVPRHL